MKGVAFRVFAGILCAVASAQGAAADPEPLAVLELVTTSSKVTPGADSLVLVVRRGEAAGKAVSLRAPEGAKLWLADADGTCSTPVGQKAALNLDASAANPALVCFSMKNLAAGVRVVATVSAGSALYNAATQPFDIAEPPSESIWEKPGVSVILSALVGFLFGLGSSWLQVFFDSRKEDRVARSDSQKFIAESLFPELRGHANALAKYLAADPAELQNLCVILLEVPEITAALSGDRVIALASYFDSVSLRFFKAQLREYDTNLDGYNRWADRLKPQTALNRDPGEQKLIATRLYASLKSWKIA